MKFITHLLLLVFFTLFIRPIHSQQWVPSGKIAPADRQAGNELGIATSSFGNDIFIGDRWYCQPSAPFFRYEGAVHVYEVDTSGNFQVRQILQASDKEDGDWFGMSVDVHGSHAIIGAPSEDHDASGQNFFQTSGSAYIFSKDSPGMWTEKQKITASDRADNVAFGEFVAISDSFALVGAQHEMAGAAGSNPIPGAGAVYVFRLDASGTWQEVQKLLASDRSQDGRFGRSVHIDGDYALIGSSLRSVNLNGQIYEYAGVAYFFERDSSGLWTETQQFITPHPKLWGTLGERVHISGRFAWIAASGEDYDNNQALNSSGVVYVFQRDTLGFWNPFQQLVPADIQANDRFGSAIDSYEGKIVISAIGRAIRSGVVYLFEQDSLTGLWAETQSLRAPVPENGADFGYSVSIFDKNICVGAYREDAGLPGQPSLVDAGAAYVFHKDEVPPQVVISSPHGLLTTVNPFPIDILFSEPVYGFDSTGISISGGIVTQLSGGPEAFSAWVVPDAPATLAIQIPDSVAQDLATNPNLASDTFFISYAFPTSVDHAMPNGWCHVFPNPVNDYLYVEIHEKETIDFAYILMDLQGNVIESGKIIQERMQIQMDPLASGCYFLQITDAKGGRFIQKVMKN